MNDLYLGRNALGHAAYAGRNFAVGDLVAQFSGDICSAEDLPEISSPEDDRYMQVGRSVYMGPSGWFDDYCNHSCDPNAGVADVDGSMWLIAIRPIEAGDEIVWDYSTTMDEDDWEMDCRCGSPACRGRIRDFKHLELGLQLKYVSLGIVPDFVLQSVSPDLLSSALRFMSGQEPDAPLLEKLALSIDGPSKKKSKGKGGKSPPTVTLLDVEMTEDGGVKQSWGVYAEGQKVGVHSVTDAEGDTKILGNDLDLGEGGLTAQQAVAHILQGAHPRYYPKPGKTVVLDSAFVHSASRS